MIPNNTILHCIPFCADIPEDAVKEESEDDEKKTPDERMSMRASDKRIACDEDFSDSDDEGEGGRKNRESFKRKKFKIDGEHADKELEKGNLKYVCLCVCMYACACVLIA